MSAGRGITAAAGPRTGTVVSLPAAHMLRGLLRVCDAEAGSHRRGGIAAQSLQLHQAVEALGVLRTQFASSALVLDAPSGKGEVESHKGLSAAEVGGLLHFIDRLIVEAEQLSAAMSVAASSC